MRLLLVSGLLIAAGCVGGPPSDPFVPTESTLHNRMLTTRQFDGISKADLLSASAGVLQGLGFNRADGSKEFRASVVVRPADGTADRTPTVRVTFHRKVWLTNVADGNEGKAFK